MKFYYNGLPDKENQRREDYLKTRQGRWKNWLADCLEGVGEGFSDWCACRATKIRPLQPLYGLKNFTGVTALQLGKD